MNLSGIVLRASSSDAEIGKLWSMILKTVNADKAVSDLTVGGLNVGGLIASTPLAGIAQSLVNGATAAIDKLPKAPLPNLMPAAGLSVWLVVQPETAIMKSGNLLVPVPPTVLKTTTGPDGRFAFSTPTHLNGRKAQVCIAKVTTQKVDFFPTPLTITYPWYRSDEFVLRAGSVKTVPVIVYIKPAAAGEGITQERVNEEMKKTKAKEKMSKLSGAIKGESISVVGEKDDATIRFSIGLSPCQTGPLDEYVSTRVYDYDLDLPGPDALVELCVDEQQIERQIRASGRALMKQVNSELKTRFAESLKAGIPAIGGAVSAAAQELVTMSINDIRNVVISESKMGPITWQLSDLLFDVAVGFPRQFA